MESCAPNNIELFKLSKVKAMKNLKYIVLFLASISFSTSIFAQSINWSNLNTDQKHLANLNIGWEYGLVYSAGYGYKLKSKNPIVLGLSYSFPSGKNLLDDFKTKIGGQIAFLNTKNFQFSGSVHGVYRRYQNPLVRMQNFGCELGLTAGYYKPKWFIAAETGFDKAIVTHFKHSDLFKEVFFSEVQNGWYEPATGGNFKCGIATGFSFPTLDITFNIGKVITQSFNTSPLIPYYLTLGATKKF